MLFIWLGCWYCVVSGGICVAGLSDFLPGRPIRGSRVRSSLKCVKKRSSHVGEVVLNRGRVGRECCTVGNKGCARAGTRLVTGTVTNLFSSKFTTGSVRLLSYKASAPSRVVPSRASVIRNLLGSDGPVPVLSPSKMYYSTTRTLRCYFLSMLSKRAGGTVYKNSRLFSPLLHSGVFRRRCGTVDRVRSGPCVTFRGSFLE